MIHGGTGWMGLVLLEMLNSALGTEFSKRVRVYGRKQGVIALRDGTTIVCNELFEASACKKRPTIFFHLAFVTRDKLSAISNAEFIAQNRALTQQVLDLLNKADIQALFVPSSGAVYAADGSTPRDYESNPYGALKLDSECLFSEFCVKRSVPLSLPRVFNVAGPHMNKLDVYVLGSIIRDLYKGGPIRLNADRPVYRSFVHMKDLLGIAMAFLLADKSGTTQRFDTRGEEVIEVGNLASRVSTLLGYTDISIERPADWSYRPENRYVGYGNGFATEAERYNLDLTNLDQQIFDTAQHIYEHHLFA